jgi:hypothetical protein
MFQLRDLALQTIQATSDDPEGNLLGIDVIGRQTG